MLEHIPTRSTDMSTSLDRRGSAHSLGLNSVPMSPVSHSRNKSLGNAIGMAVGGSGGVPMSPHGSLGSPQLGADFEWADIQAR